MTLRGHSSGVASLAFSSDGMVLASGGRDSDIILWDIVGGKGSTHTHSTTGESRFLMLYHLSLFSNR